MVRGRTAGAAIVTEARRRGVEAIVLAAEEPSRIRGGAILGGRGRASDRFAGETTRYVIEKAPCKVILTAPPAEAPDNGPNRRAEAAQAAAELCSAIVGFNVRPDRRLRPGGLVDRQVDARRGARGVGARREPRGHRAAQPRAGRRAGRTSAAPSRSAPRSRSTRCWQRASTGRRLRRLHRRRQHQPGDRPDRQAALRDRPRGGARARPGPGALVRASRASRPCAPPRRRSSCWRPRCAARSASRGWLAALDVHPDRRRGQGRLEPRARARSRRRTRSRSSSPTAAATRWSRRSSSTHPVRRRHRAVGARARRHRARRPRDRRDRRRRGQHPDLPDGAREVRRGAGRRPLQQPAQPPALRAARRQAGGVGHRPDPAPDRARGAQVRPGAPARPQGGAAGDHRDGGGRGLGGRRRRWSRTSACPTARW